MIDALLCFPVGRVRHWTTGQREQERNKSGGQVKDLQLQKVSVLSFALEAMLL